MLSCGVANQIILAKKLFPIIRVRSFDAVTILQTCTKIGIGAESLTHDISRNAAAAKTTRHYNSRYVCDFNTIVLKTCYGRADFLFMLALGNSVFFRRKKNPTHRAPKPRKASAPARQRPQILLQVFPQTFTISTLRPSSQDFESFRHPSKTFQRNKPQSF